MTVQTGYYQIGNDGLWVALPTTEAGTALSLQYDDGSAGLKWHFDKHDGGAYYFIYSEYDDSEYSSGKLGASTTILQSNASIVGAKSSKQWIVTAVPGKKYTITISISGYAWTNVSGQLELLPLDQTYKDERQWWHFKLWQMF